MEENQSEELKIMPRGTAPRSLRKGRNMIAVASGKGGKSSWDTSAAVLSEDNSVCHTDKRKKG